jgi:micrococcal nuclease
MQLKKIIFIIIALVVITSSAYAHSGRTDKNGGHTCRTNCDKYGLDYGEYHYHSSSANTYTTVPTPTTTTSTPTPTPEIISYDRFVNVTSVVDGDTVYVDYREKVRLVGVDTPEIKDNGGVDARNYVVKRLLDKNLMGKQVYLDVDNANRKDRYGRTLAAIFLDGENFNTELLCEGYAEVMYIPPSEFNPNDWKESCSDVSASITSTPMPDFDNASLTQEIASIKERLNKTEEAEKKNEVRISWIEDKVKNLLSWFGLN